jgi:hypothetical protein
MLNNFNIYTTIFLWNTNTGLVINSYEVVVIRSNSIELWYRLHVGTVLEIVEIEE